MLLKHIFILFILISVCFSRNVSAQTSNISNLSNEEIEKLIDSYHTDSKKTWERFQFFFGMSKMDANPDAFLYGY